jgi:hypothetical protein
MPARAHPNEARSWDATWSKNQGLPSRIANWIRGELVFLRRSLDAWPVNPNPPAHGSEPGVECGPPGRIPSNFTSLTVGSIQELRAHEVEIVRRISDTPNGSRLLLLNARRLLRELNVNLAPEAIEAWNQFAGGALNQEPAPDAVYEAAAQSEPMAWGLKFRVRGLLKPEEKAS